MTPQLVNIEPLAPGVMLRNGRFRVVGGADDGEGGMAQVYVAEDLENNRRQVAVKEMRPRYTEKGLTLRQQRAQFNQEAELLARFSHRCIPRFIDAFEDNQRAFIAMEFVPGLTLFRYMCTHKDERADLGLPAPQVLRWSLVLCDVLGYLHGLQPEKIIYRDLDPTNVMITRTEEIKLIDFGIARKHKRASSKDTIIMGKFGFVAPEIYRHQTDERSDVYSLGATMYALLSGNSNVPDWHGKTQPRPLRDTFGDIPAPVSDVVWQAMAEQPRRRFATAAAMAAAIEEALVQVGQSSSTPRCRHCGANSRLGARFCCRCGGLLHGRLEARLRVRGHAMGATVAEGGSLIGRACRVQGIYPDLDLGLIDAQFVSRAHARVVRAPQGFGVQDLGSRNGTRVNGRPLPREGFAPLRSGDVIEVGAVAIEFGVLT